MRHPLLLSALVLFLLGTTAPSYGQTHLEWARTLGHSTGNDAGTVIVRDAAGNIYVGGTYNDGNDTDYLVAKYDSLGSRRWWRFLDHAAGDDTLRAMTVSGAYLYVTGQGYNGSDCDYWTLAINASTGSTYRQATYDGGHHDHAYGIVATAGGVYVTGESYLSYGLFHYYEAVTRKYDFDLNTQWTETYTDTRASYATSIAADASGNVYVAGSASDLGVYYDLLVISYSSAGAQRWDYVEDGPGGSESDLDILYDVAVRSDRVYATGKWNAGALPSPGMDYVTVCLQTSNGSEVWARTYDGGRDDKAKSLAIAPDGTIWVTGTGDYDTMYGLYYTVTIHYSSGGSTLCKATATSFPWYADACGRDVAVNPFGYACVAGAARNKCTTITYRPTSSTCDEFWREEYGGAGPAADTLHAVVADSGAMYVTGTFYNEAQGNYDVVTMKYRTYGDPVVTSPNGGEYWYAGSSHPITWDPSRPDGNVRIEWTDEASVPSPTWSSVIASTPDDGEHDWLVPYPWDPSPDCRVKVSDIDGSPYDVSDSPFTIYWFRPYAEGWGFPNTADVMWPISEYVDYSDPQYPVWWRWVCEPWDFPSWPLFVAAFGESECYLRPPPAPQPVYRPSATAYWMAIKGEWHGSCPGFATSAYLFFDQYLNWQAYFPGYEYLFHVPPDAGAVMPARDLVNTYATHIYGRQHLAWFTLMLLTKTPTETLNECLDMFAASQLQVHRWLCFAKSDGRAFHMVNPTRVVQDGGDPDTYYIYIYDNMYPGSDDCRITVDLATDSWSYPWEGWHGTHAGLFLMDSLDTYLSPPQLPFGIEGGDQIQLATVDSVDAVFRSGGRGVTIGTAQVVTAVPVSLDNQAWTCEFSKIPADSFFFDVFTPGTTVLTCSRGGVDTTDHETAGYLGDDRTGWITNVGGSVRSYDVGAILGAGTGTEKVCRALYMPLAPGDTVRFGSAPDGNFDIDHLGPEPTDYCLGITLVTSAQEIEFAYAHVPIPGTCVHRVVIDPATLDDSVLVRIDDDRNGTFEDSTWLTLNQTSVPDSPTVLPTEIRLAGIKPNPFRERAEIAYALPREAQVTIEIFDVRGRKVSTIYQGPQRPGVWTATWDAADSPAGIYFCRLQVGDVVRTQRMVLLK